MCNVRLQNSMRYFSELNRILTSTLKEKNVQHVGELIEISVRL